MSEPTSSSPVAVPQQARRIGFRLHRGDHLFVRILIAVLLSMLCAGALVAVSGHDPVAAFVALVTGAVGSPHQIGAAFNRTTPYLLAGGGVAMCFRAGIINIGAEGQIAVGGMGTAAVALVWFDDLSAVSTVAALLGGAGAGALWAGLAAAIHLGRRVHEVLATLLLNFVALLLVQQVLAGPLGEFGAGFPVAFAAARELAAADITVQCTCRISDRRRRRRPTVLHVVAHAVRFRVAGRRPFEAGRGLCRIFTAPSDLERHGAGRRSGGARRWHRSARLAPPPDRRIFARFRFQSRDGGTARRAGAAGNRARSALRRPA